MSGSLQHLPAHRIRRLDDFFGRGPVEITSPIPCSGQASSRRIAVASSKLLERPAQSINTVPDILSHAVRKYGSQHYAIGYRDVIQTHHEEKELSLFIDGREISEKRAWKLLEMSDYKYISYAQFADAVTDIRNGLLGLGIQKNDVVNIYAQSGLSWQLMNNACASISTPMAVSHETLGVDGLIHSVKEPDCAAIFTNADLLPTLCQVVAHTPKLKHIFYDGAPSASSLKSIRDARGDIHVLHINALRAIGRSQDISRIEAIVRQRQPRSDTLACIMYTSGSTRKPNGVMITHGNLIASLASVNLIFGSHIVPGDVYLAYLSLAHVSEYVVELCALYAGITIGYGRLKTLTEAGVKNCKSDLAALRPHIMIGAPSVWEELRKGIVGHLNDSGVIKRTMFNVAMEAQRKGVPVLGGLGDNMVLNKVRETTGGRLKFLLNNGGRVCKETQQFLSVAIAPMLEGYGMAESCGICTLLPPGFSKYGSVGFPCPSVEVKLFDLPSSSPNYFEIGIQIQGEICIRGPSVFKGYFKRPALNYDSPDWTKDGWFRTGDIGQWNPDGTLSVIGRIENMIKLKNGDFIALEKLESIYRSCDVVSNLCLIARPAQPYLVAVLSVHQVNLRHTISNSYDAAISRLDGAATSTLAACPYIRHLLLSSCVDVGIKNGLHGSELLHAVVVAREEWTLENGLLTPGMKVNRTNVTKFYEKQISAAYAT